MSEKVRVFIASENRLVRESLSRILSKRCDLEVVSSQGLADALGDAMHSDTEVLVLDSLE